ncbi:MAG TPA: hypothetical protein VGH89_38320 [Pseudonocardia sp.]|jgi:hypothetical protein
MSSIEDGRSRFVGWYSWDVRDGVLVGEVPWPAHPDGVGPEVSAGAEVGRAVERADAIGCVVLRGQPVDGARGRSVRGTGARPLVVFVAEQVSEPRRDQLAANYRVPVHRLPCPTRYLVAALHDPKIEARAAALRDALARSGAADPEVPGLVEAFIRQVARFAERVPGLRAEQAEAERIRALAWPAFYPVPALLLVLAVLAAAGVSGLAAPVGAPPLVAGWLVAAGWALVAAVLLAAAGLVAARLIGAGALVGRTGTRAGAAGTRAGAAGTRAGEAGTQAGAAGSLAGWPAVVVIGKEAAKVGIALAVLAALCFDWACCGVAVFRLVASTAGHGLSVGHRLAALWRAGAPVHPPIGYWPAVLWAFGGTTTFLVLALVLGWIGVTALKFGPFLVYPVVMVVLFGYLYWAVLRTIGDTWPGYLTVLLAGPLLALALTQTWQWLDQPPRFQPMC